jgi:hypothetical protein
MASLRDAMVYVCKNYPYPEHLSFPRFSGILYLADWRSAITREQILSDAQWLLTAHGPVNHALLSVLQHDRAFHFTATMRAHSSPPPSEVIIGAAAKAEHPSVSAEEQAILDFAIRSVINKDPMELARLIHSTFPVVTQPRDSSLDLVALARRYKETIGLITTDESAGDRPTSKV